MRDLRSARDRLTAGRGEPAGTRRHALVPHTADVGFTASAPDLPELFEEAATALAELSAEIAPTAGPSVWHDVALRADDLSGLLYAWLNELIALGEIHRGAIADSRVERLDGPDATDDRTWVLEGRVGLCPYTEPGVRVLRHPKSATYHGLTAEGGAGAWTMRAYVDV